MQVVMSQRFRDVMSHFSNTLYKLGGAAALSSCLVAMAGAQTAHLSGAQSVVVASSDSALQGEVPASVAVYQGNVFVLANGGGASNGLLLKETFAGGNYSESAITTGVGLNPESLAIDTNGNIYIADSSNNRVLKEAPSDNGYSETTVKSDLNHPGGVAVDGTGNVYIADTGSGSVLKEAPGPEGYISSTVVSGLVPTGVAVDGAGNVYVGDSGHGQVLEETPSGSSYVENTIVSGARFSDVRQIAVDSGGSLYIANGGGSGIAKETLLGCAFVESVVGSGLSGPSGVAVDASGNVFIADSGHGRVLRVAPGGGDFGPVMVNSQSAAMTLNFAVDTAGTLGSIQVVAGGNANLDYSSAGTGTCTAAQSYNAGDTCSVDLNFTPKFAGARYGAVILQNSSGHAIATGYVQGTGSGPQIGFLPGAQSVVRSSPSNLAGVAVDGSGNIYVAEPEDNYVVKETLSSDNNYAESIVPTTLLSSPADVAVDGAGNVYIVDTNNQRVLKETPSGNSYVETQIATANRLNNPTGIAVDGSGNIYITDLGSPNRVVKESVSAGSYAESTVVTGPFTGAGLAVDSIGNVYIAEVQASGGVVVKETPSGSTYTESQVATDLLLPTGIAVDKAGNVYVTDGGADKVYMETLTGSGYTQTTVSNPFSTVAGVTVDGLGNVYLSGSDRTGGLLIKKDIADAPSLVFAKTKVGATSTAQLVTVENLGNMPLTFTAPASGDAPLISVDFALDTTGSAACPLAAPSLSAPVTLQAGTSCTFSVSFAPTTTGKLDGSLVLTDNNLNASASTQKIALSGTAIPVDPTEVNVSVMPTQTAVGQPVTVTAEVNDKVAGSTPTGSVTFTDTVGGTTAPLNGGAAVQLSNGSASLTLIPTSLGTHTITANYLGVVGDFAASTDSTTLLVTPLLPKLTFAPIASQVFGEPPFAVSATSASSGLVTYAVVSGPATLAGNMVTLTGTGTVVLKASQAASGNYAAATATITFGSVSPTVPTLSFAPIADQTFGVAPFAVSATSASPGAVTYAVGSGPATISGNMVTLTGAGTVTLNASQAASGIYAAATATTKFAVTAPPPASAPFSLTLGTGTGASGASASVSPGGAATFNLMLAPGTASVFADALTLSATGLPSGATASFSPATIAAGSSATPVLLKIQTSAQTARNEMPFQVVTFAPVALGLTLLPLLGIRSARKRLLQHSRLLPALVLAALSLACGMSLIGCGGGGAKPAAQTSPTTPTSPATPAAQTYSLVVTAKDLATSVQSSVNLTLVVQ